MSDYMERNIYRIETKFKTCTFEMEGEPRWRLIGRRIHGFSQCNFELYQDSVLKYSMKQSNIVKQIFSLIPGVAFFYKNPYYFYKNNQKCGYSKRKTKFYTGQGIYDFYFEGVIYTVTIHSMGVHSLLMNGEQIAVYSRFTDTTYGGGNYCVRYSSDLQERVDIIMLFAAFVELSMTLDTRAGIAPQNYSIFNDKHLHLARWLPKDDVNKSPFLNKWGRRPLRGTEE